MHAILGDSCQELALCITKILARSQAVISVSAILTNSGEEAADRLAIGRPDNFILAHNATTNALNHTNLACTLIVKLS